MPEMPATKEPFQLEDRQYYRALDGTVVQVFKLKNPVWRLGDKFTFTASQELGAANCYSDNGICFASSESYSGFNLVSKFDPTLSCGLPFHEIATMTPIKDGSYVISEELYHYVVDLITRASRHIPL